MSTMDSNLLDEKIKEMVDEINSNMYGLVQLSHVYEYAGRPDCAHNLQDFAGLLNGAYSNLENYPCFSSYVLDNTTCKTPDDVNYNRLLNAIMNVCIVSKRIEDNRYCNALFESHMIENTLLVMMLSECVNPSRSPYTAIYLDEIDGERSEPFANMDHLYTEQICCSIRGTTLLFVDLGYELDEPIVNALPFKSGILYPIRNYEELLDAICDRAHTITKNLARDNDIYY